MIFRFSIERDDNDGDDDDDNDGGGGNYIWTMNNKQKKEVLLTLHVFLLQNHVKFAYLLVVKGNLRSLLY